MTGTVTAGASGPATIVSGVLLAAGHGTRLRDSADYKPLCRVGGRPLIDHALMGMAEAGLMRAIVVLGYGADAIGEHLASRDWPLAVETVMTRDHREPNGVSVLAAAPLLEGEEAVLAMCDHLVSPALYARLATVGAQGGTTLGIDRRIGHPWVDPDDVTWVRTCGDAIVQIGKTAAGSMADADAYDTGVFAIGPALFDALASLAAPSLTEGMRILASQTRAFAVDCSDLDWIDVDDAAALAKAEDWMLARAA